MKLYTGTYDVLVDDIIRFFALLWEAKGKKDVDIYLFEDIPHSVLS